MLPDINIFCIIITAVCIWILKKLYNADCSRFNTICIRSTFPIRFMSGWYWYIITFISWSANTANTTYAINFFFFFSRFCFIIVLNIPILMPPLTAIYARLLIICHTPPNRYARHSTNITGNIKKYHITIFLTLFLRVQILIQRKDLSQVPLQLEILNPKEQGR